MILPESISRLRLLVQNTRRVSLCELLQAIAGMLVPVKVLAATDLLSRIVLLQGNHKRSDYALLRVARPIRVLIFTRCDHWLDLPPMQRSIPATWDDLVMCRSESLDIRVMIFCGMVEASTLQRMTVKSPLSGTEERVPRQGDLAVEMYDQLSQRWEFPFGIVTFMPVFHPGPSIPKIQPSYEVLEAGNTGHVSCEFIEGAIVLSGLQCEDDLKQ